MSVFELKVPAPSNKDVMTVPWGHMFACCQQHRFPFCILTILAFSALHNKCYNNVIINAWEITIV